MSARRKFVDGKKDCQHYIAGRCHFGDKCRFIHPTNISYVSSTVPTTVRKSPRYDKNTNPILNDYRSKWYDVSVIKPPAALMRIHFVPFSNDPIWYLSPERDRKLAILANDLKNIPLRVAPILNRNIAGWWQMEDLSSTKILSNADVIIVETLDVLIAAMKDISDCKIVGFDCEMHCYRSYLGMICSIQLSSLTKDYIIDTLALWEHIPEYLGGMFKDENILKIGHGLDYDIPCLYRDFGIVLVNVVDTQLVYRMMTAHRSCDIRLTDTERSKLVREAANIGLATLLSLYHCPLVDEIKGSKDIMTLCDWRKRPFSPSMIRYAALDSKYLIPLFQIMVNNFEAVAIEKFIIERLNAVAGSCVSDQPSEECSEPCSPPSGAGSCMLDAVIQPTCSLDTPERIVVKHQLIHDDKTNRTTVYGDLIQVNESDSNLDRAHIAAEVNTLCERILVACATSASNRMYLPRIPSPIKSTGVRKEILDATWSPAHSFLFVRLFYFREYVSIDLNESPVFVCAAKTLLRLTIEQPVSLLEIFNLLAKDYDRNFVVPPEHWLCLIRWSLLWFNIHDELYARHAALRGKHDKLDRECSWTRQSSNSGFHRPVPSIPNPNPKATPPLVQMTPVSKPATTAAMAKPAAMPKPASKAKPGAMPKPASKAKPGAMPKPASKAKPAAMASYASTA